MDSVIIGSTAIKSYFPDFNREPKDLDIAVRNMEAIAAIRQVYNEEEPDIRIEYLENPVIVKHARSTMLDPDLMLTLKMSHIFWDINWDKHMYDIQFLISKGAKCNREVFYELYQFWNEYHGRNQRSDLKMSKVDFFDNALKEYDHDTLHTLLKPNPTYVSMLADGAEVEIDEQKFENASFEDKCNLIKEEVSVMAFERFQRFRPRVAYGRMFKKYILSHAPLYVALFLLENIRAVDRPDGDFITTLKEKLNDR